MGLKWPAVIASVVKPKPEVGGDSAHAADRSMSDATAPGGECADMDVLMRMIAKLAERARQTNDPVVAAALREVKLALEAAVEEHQAQFLAPTRRSTDSQDRRY